MTRSQPTRSEQRYNRPTPWFRWMTMIVAWMAWLAGVPAAAADDDLGELEEEAFRAAVATVSPTVVRIETAGGRDRIGSVSVGQAPSTGIVVSSDGFILTSLFNMAGDPAAILVTLEDGSRLPARKIASDHSRKLVLLKIDPDDELPVPQWRDRSELQVGQWTIAIGRVFDPRVTNISIGVLSATQRIWGKAIQTDAKISPHNYGGPLIDVEGRVLGILVPMSPRTNEDVAGTEWYDSGIGFAVPIAELRESIERMKLGEDRWPGQLGVSLEGANIYSDPAKLAVVQAGSPAAQAGLRVGDTIVSMDGQSVARQAQLKHALGPRYAGDSVRIGYDRDGVVEEVEVELAERILPYEHPFLGILADRESSDDGEDKSLDGIGIRYVYPDSAVFAVGLVPGDRIMAIAGQACSSIVEAQNAIARFEPLSEIEITVQRKDADQAHPLRVQLGRIPTETPTGIPPVVADDVDEAIARDRAIVPVIIPEEQGTCKAIVPRNLDRNRSYGVLVWFHAAGQYDEQRMLTDWLPLCEQYQIILVVPRSSDERRWARTDLEFARKTLDHVMSTYPTDPTRVAAYGFQSGGSMAVLFACTYRELLHGFAVIDANLVREAIRAETEPLQRLSIYAQLSSEHSSTDSVAAGLEQMRQVHFPVTVRRVEGASRRPTESERHDLMRWFDSLDRF